MGEENRQSSADHDCKVIEKKYRERLASLARYRENNQRCSYCGHTGVIIAMSLTHRNAEYSFLCPHCSSAEIQELNYPAWRRDLESQYYPVWYATFIEDMEAYKAKWK